ncbi:Spy/CpxP family protein refolding chaperone [Variovorax sp. GB1R11]|uniref:Spy/CpxP family protein refolding chaperone n=1 Tax=Variovorax sp. GB1R11 TaxID=3443741 RepID=UPI003F468D8C
MMKRPLHRLALAAALLAVSTHGFAQFGGGGSGMGGGGRRGARPDSAASPRNGDALSTPATAAGKVRDKLYDLRLQLMIEPAQSPLWDRFSDAVWELVGRGGMAGAAPSDEQTAVQFAQQRAVQFAQQRAAQAQGRAQRVQSVSDALSALYNALTPEQRHIADQNLPAVIP